MGNQNIKSQKDNQNLSLKNLQLSKETEYQRFNYIKEALSDITHKRIVQLLFLKYTPINLTTLMKNQETSTQNAQLSTNYILKEFCHVHSLNLNMQSGRFEYNKESLDIIVKELIMFKNIVSLNINLKSNNLQDNSQCIIFLSDGLKNLKNLQNLTLNLQDNRLGSTNHQGKTLKAFESLGKSIKNLQNLVYFHLNISHQNFVQYQEIFQFLEEAFQRKKKLKHLVYKCFYNNLANNIQFKSLGGGLKFLENLEIFDLDLSGNYLEGDLTQQLDSVGDGLSKLKKLKSFSLNLFGNKFGSNINNLRFLENILQGMEELNRFKIDLQYNDLYNKDFSENCLGFLRDGFKGKVNLRFLDLNLNYNNLADSQNSLQCLSEGLKNLVELESLVLNIQSNYLGRQGNSHMNYLILGLKELKKLKFLELNLSSNQLGDNNRNDIGVLAEGIEGMKDLEHLHLNLQFNKFGQCSDNIDSLRFLIEKMGLLKGLKLSIDGNSLEQQQDNVTMLLQSIKGKAKELQYLELYLEQRSDIPVQKFVDQLKEQGVKVDYFKHRIEED